MAASLRQTVSFSTVVESTGCNFSDPSGSLEAGQIGGELPRMALPLSCLLCCLLKFSAEKKPETQPAHREANPEDKADDAKKVSGQQKKSRFNSDLQMALVLEASGIHR